MNDLGTDIRHQREAKHMTIEELSEKTKISVAVLKDIENGKFDRYKGDEAYVKMYLKKISKVLTMDTNALTQQYIDLTREIELHDLQEKEEQMNHNEEVVKKGKRFSFDAPELARKPSVYEDKSHVTIVRTIVILALVCLIIVVIWYGFYSTRSKDPDPSFQPQNPPTVEGNVGNDSEDYQDPEKNPVSTQVQIERTDVLNFHIKLPTGAETFKFKMEFGNRSWAKMYLNGESSIYSGFEERMYHNYSGKEPEVIELEFQVAEFESLILRNGYGKGHQYYINDQLLPLTEEDSQPGICELHIYLDKE